MAATDTERLYRLLPALYRRRDEAEGGALRAVLAVVESELLALETAVDAQYENWFIETCDEAVVARIGELVGVPAASPGTLAAASPRTLVADAIRRRRSKGVASALEEVARDLSGWPVRVVEYFPLLGQTQHVRYPREGRGGTVDLRAAAAIDLHAGPFEVLPARIDVRRVSSGRGRHNVPNVGVFVWPGEVMCTGPVESAAVPGRPGCFTFHPLGLDQQLVVLPVAVRAGDRPGLAELPVRLSRSLLDRHLDELIGADRSVGVELGGRWLGADDVTVADLGTWPAPQHAGARVLIDPELGRIALPAAAAAGCRVRYGHRVPAALGGGSYDRSADLVPATEGGRAISAGGPEGPAAAAALAGPHEPGDVLTLVTDAVVDDPVTLTLPTGGRLVVQAADGVRPVLRAGLRVEAPEGAELVLDGVLVGGPLTLVGSVQLTLRHCEITGGIAASGGPHAVAVGRCLLGPVTSEGTLTLDAEDCVVDAGTEGGGGVALGAGAVALRRVTVLGATAVDRLTAADCLFDTPVQVQRRQSGAMRYCFVPPGSSSPPRFRCQPDQALDALSRGGVVADPEQVLARVRPRLRSHQRGSSGYAELDPGGALEIIAGAESGSEQGAHASRLRPQRLAALQGAIDEYLPYGLEAGIIDVS